MRQSVLTDQQARLLREEKEALAEIRLALADLEVPGDALAALQKAILQLDELFLLVVVGEFNAGKSALVNALLGERVLPEGATPTTSRVTLVNWGEHAGEQVVDESFAIYTYPLPLLKELNIVDTPGTNAVIRRHERLTDEFVPRSDLVIFATSADRPMTESERQFLERILAWGKKVIFVLNKVDILEDEAALQDVKSFVLKHATNMLGDPPELFPVSARLAQRAWDDPDPEQRRRLREASRLDDLERYISATLDDATRLALKFNNPLGVADNLIAQAQATVQKEAEAVREDGQTVASLEAVITAYERELHSELPPRLAEVENILHRLEQRGLDFFDTTLRLTKIMDLARGDRVRAQFEKQVLADVPQQIEDQVQRLIDWLVQKDLHEWQQVMAYLQRRRARYIEHMVGESGGRQETRRRELIDSVGRTVQSIVETYDRNQEASQLASSVEAAVAQTALLEAGAVGLGALVTLAVVSSAVDITGMLAAGTLAILGFFVIPYKRKRAKDVFKEKMQVLRTRLLSALTTQFTHESESAITRLKDGVAPYTRFIRAEHERTAKAEASLVAMRQRLSALRARSKTVVG
ncbi:MAG: dynamin family protein [Anaerolineales bacterium]|nr:dynamin family protein [Anaerolineales bacterium]